MAVLKSETTLRSGFDWKMGLLDANGIRLVQDLYIHLGYSRDPVVDRL
jgi:hypothetical protein